MDTDPRSSVNLQIAVICIGSFFVPMLINASTLGIPAMSRELAIDTRLISWLPLAMVLASSMTQFPVGKLGSIFGRKHIFIAGLLFVVLASLVGAVAKNGETLVLSRSIQGIGNALVFATSLTLISDLVPEHMRGQVTGIYVGIAYLGVTGGPLFGGVVIENLGWRSVFYIPIPFLLAVSVAAAYFLPQTSRDDDKSFDYIGSLDYALGVLILALSLLNITSPLAVVGIFAGVATLAIFVSIQRRAANPLVDIELFTQNRSFGYLCLVLTLFNAGLFSIPFVLTLYLQYIQALSAQTAGFVLMAQAVSTAIMAPTTGRLLKRFSSVQLCYTGVALGIAGLLIGSLLTRDSSLWQLVTAIVLLGISAGMVETPLISFMMSSVDERNRGAASASINSTRILGSLISIAVISLFLNLLMGDALITREVFPQLVSAVKSYFGVATLFACAAAFTLWRAIRSARRHANS